MRITQCLVEKMRDDGVIREDEYRIYLYGMELLEIKLLAVLLAVGISILFQTTLFLFVLLLFLVPIRKYAGGIHASSEGKCLLFTELILLAAELMWKYSLWPDFLQHLSVGLGLVAIIMLSPAESKRRRLTKQKRHRFRNLSIGLGVFEAVCYYIAFTFEGEIIGSAVSLTMLIMAILLFLTLPEKTKKLHENITK